jgi:hypothetical protein
MTYRDKLSRINDKQRIRKPLLYPSELRGHVAEPIQDEQVSYF